MQLRQPVNTEHGKKTPTRYETANKVFRNQEQCKEIEEKEREGDSIAACRISFIDRGRRVPATSS